MTSLRRFIVFVFMALGTATAAHAVSADENARFEGCRTKLKQAQKLDVLYDLDWKPGREPKVVVGPTFFNMPFDAKENFVRTVNCFLMVGADKAISFDVLDYRTGKAVGRFSWGQFKMN
jgi:hypothetical protein